MGLRASILSIMVCLALSLAGSISSAHAAAPERRGNMADALDDWQRRHIGPQEGAPPTIQVIAQTPDGYIWLGARDGLYRYDGLKFQRFAPSSPKPLQSETVTNLLAEPNGDLWVGHDWGGLSLVRGDRHTPVLNPALHTMFGLVRGADGSSWAVSVRGSEVTAAKLVGKRWTIAFKHTFKHGYFISPVVDREGLLWVIHNEKLYRLAPSGNALVAVLENISLTSSLTLGSDGEVWLASSGRLRRVLPARVNGRVTLGPPEFQVITDELNSLLFSERGILWQIAQSGVLTRFEYTSPSGSSSVALSKVQRKVGDATEHYIRPPMMVDLEGSLWVATTSGLDQYHRSKFDVPATLQTDGDAGFTDPVVVRDGRGDVWIRHKDRLFQVTASGKVRATDTRIPTTYTPCPGRLGGVWVPDGKGKIALVGGPAPRALSLSGVRAFTTQFYYYCAEDSVGRLWADEGDRLIVIGPAGLSTVPLGDDDKKPIAVMIADRTGRIIAYVGRRSLWMLDGRSRKKIWRKEDMALGFIEFMYQGPSYLLFGGDRGLVRYDGRRFQMLTRARLPDLGFVSGAVQTRGGYTWLQTARGVVRVKTSELDRAFVDSGFNPEVRLFTQADGLPGSTPFWNLSNITADRWDRVWIGTNKGVAVFDPRSKATNSLPPPLYITAVRAGGKTMSSDATTILPTDAGRIEIDFAALSFVDPARVKVRYRLSGVDGGWIKAGMQRTATYTNLTPGRYVFEVIGANDDGVWNRTGAKAEFVVLARFYQTPWFLALCIVAALAALWLAYRWRLDAVSRRLRAQAAERGSERERIARELHDTLLQSVYGLVLRVAGVSSRMGVADPNRLLLDESLDQADSVIAEGQARVFDLRSTELSADMTALLTARLERTPFPPGMATNLVERGGRRPVVSGIAREITELVGEALTNAARHSEAREISVTLSYGARRFQVSVTDDGIGFRHAERARGSRTGFGLIGMRERAKRIGGVLKVQPGEDGGTLVELTLAGRRAYSRDHAP